MVVVDSLGLVVLVSVVLIWLSVVFCMLFELYSVSSDWCSLVMLVLILVLLSRLVVLLLFGL